MNKEQKAAAFSTAKRVLCVAGPGSGKTTTLVEAVAAKCRLNGPQSVICITYTNAGANEMRKRLAELPVDKGGPITNIGFVGTLHAFLLRLLQKQFKPWLPCAPAVVDDDAREDLLAVVVEELGCKCSKKKLLELLDDVRLIPGTKGRSYTKDELVAVEFHRRLRTNGLLTYDALLYYGEILIKALAGWSYKHLFVDEFQDSAFADYRIYDAMPCETKFLVGDPDQAIYGFRGSKVEIICQLTALSWGWEVYKLETNYRCQANIAAAAQRLISHNVSRINKHTVAFNPGGTVTCHVAASPAQELYHLGDEICELVHSVGEELGSEADAAVKDLCREMAVLCRTNKAAREVADFLKSRGLPVAFTEPAQEPRDWKAAKLLVAALANPASNVAWLALIAAVDGPDAAKLVKRNADFKMKSVREASQELDRWRKDGLPAFATLLSHESRARLHKACQELSGAGEWSFSDLSNYLRSGEQQETRKEGITVTTLHGAKGLEWDVVFVMGCEEGNIPQAKKDTNLEEERRLMFVAMTRARLQLHVSWCSARPQNRGPNLPPGPLEPRQPSRFIAEAVF